MNTILQIAKVNILDIFRDLRAHGIVFVLPVVFMVVFGVLLGRTTNDITFELALSEDIKVDAAQLYNALEDARNGDKDLFEITLHDDANAIKDLIREGNTDLGLYLDDSGEFVIITDPGRQSSSIANSIMMQFLKPSQDEGIKTEEVSARENITMFEYQAAGLIVYGVLIMIPQVSGGLSTMIERRYLTRYALSNVRSYQVIFGFTLSSLFVGLVQTILLFYVSTWFGVGLDGYTITAFIFILPLILFAIGAGLLIGAFASKSESAQNTGTILSIILGFLSGSFFVGIDSVGFNIGDRFFAITDFIPTFYATDGIIQLIIYRSDFSEVATSFAVITLSAILLFAIGIVAFRPRMLR